MWQTSCILLGSALLKSSWVGMSEGRWWILSLVMKCERWIDQHDTSVEQRKNLSPNTGWTLYPLSYADSWSFNWVYTGQASCILLGSALLKSSRVVKSEWRVLIAQWIVQPPGVWQVMGLIPVTDSVFFFVLRPCHVDQFTFHKT